jgi:hypothetical protein
MLEKIGHGVILWMIPSVTAIPLMGLMRSDPIFFKTMKLPAAICRISCHILRNRYPFSPWLRRVRLVFILAATYGVCGEGEL